MFSFTADIRYDQSIRRIDMTLEESEITALIGSSGAGKTSILECIAGFKNVPMHIKMGDSLWVEGKRKTPIADKGIGYAAQTPLLFPHMTVRENILFAHHKSSVFNLDDVVSHLSLSAILDTNAQLLSGGQKQRVSLARALLAAQNLLLLDEPLSALDMKARTEILKFLRSRIKSYGLMTIYVSHHLEEVTYIADSAIWVEAMQIKAQGALGALLLDEALPFLEDADAQVLVESEFVRYEKDERVSYLSFAGGEFQISKDLTGEKDIRLHIKARDVSLSRAKPGQSSILNVFEAEVISLNQDSAQQVTVVLKIGATDIVSRISFKSMRVLDLAVGDGVYAQIKGVAVIS